MSQGDVPNINAGETDAPLLADKWTRVYFDDSSFMDFDANAANIIIDAIENGDRSVTVISMFGETHYIVVSRIQVVTKRNKAALIRIWQEAAEWEALRKQYDKTEW